MSDATSNGQGDAGNVEKAVRRRDDVGPLTDEIGTTGLRQFAGYVDEERLPQLRGDRALDYFRQMRDNDPIVGGMLLAVENKIRGLDWNVEPHDDSDEDSDSERVEFVGSLFEDMSHSWQDTVASIVDEMFTYGWNYSETVYKRRRGRQSRDGTEGRDSQHDDGLIGWRKIATRPATTREKWHFDDTGGVQALWQRDPTGGIWRYIPIGRAGLFRTTTARGNPEGRSMLRNAFRPWWFKTSIERIEGIGVERDLAGLPVAWVPPQLLSGDASADEKRTLAQIQKLVQNVRRNEDEGIVMPLAHDENGNRRYDLTLLSSGGRRQFDLDSTIARYDQRIAMAALADFLLLGHEKIGTQALSVSKIDMFEAALIAWVESITGVFNRHLIPRVLALNGMPAENPPQLTYGPVAQEDIGEVFGAVKTLADAGWDPFPDDEMDRWVRERIGAPKRAEEAPEPEPPAPEDIGPPPGSEQVDDPGAGEGGAADPASAAPPEGVEAPGQQ